MSDAEYQANDTYRSDVEDKIPENDAIQQDIEDLDKTPLRSGILKGSGTSSSFAVKPVLIGVLICHVDDLFMAGKGKRYDESRSCLEKEVQLTYQKSPFTYCGKKVEQEKDFTIRVSQEEAILVLEEWEAGGARKRQTSARLEEEEKSELRRLIGSLSWIARQTRPDVLAN
eukprot:5419272-Amphidinium_carterae.1